MTKRDFGARHAQLEGPPTLFGTNASGTNISGTNIERNHVRETKCDYVQQKSEMKSTPLRVLCMAGSSLMLVILCIFKPFGNERCPKQVVYSASDLFNLWAS